MLSFFRAMVIAADQNLKESRSLFQLPIMRR
jgi:hypothetical protein